MSPGAHQWPVNPAAIAVRPQTTRTLCHEPKCHLLAEYQVASSRQETVHYCQRHTKATIRRAIGKPPSLVKMLRTTQEKDSKIQRTGHRHIHWPAGDRADDQMEEIEKFLTVYSDTALCGVYVSLRYMAREKGEITCPKCQRR